MLCSFKAGPYLGLSQVSYKKHLHCCLPWVTSRLESWNWIIGSKRNSFWVFRILISDLSNRQTLRLTPALSAGRHLFLNHLLLHRSSHLFFCSSLTRYYSPRFSFAFSWPSSNAIAEAATDAAKALAVCSSMLKEDSRPAKKPRLNLSGQHNFNFNFSSMVISSFIL
jgi:hypothetical protein